MSLFLGKIHYWLYEKIKWFSKIEGDLIKLAQEEGIDTSEIKSNMVSKYGEGIDIEKPLEDLIDTSNIHGWLQSRINIAQGRVAMITYIILDKVDNGEAKIKEIYRNQGIDAADEVIESNETKISSAKDIYECMNDYILDGMPCDRVNEVMVINDEEVIWKRTISVHKDSFHNEKVDVNSFYNMRDEWIKSFVAQLNSQFDYEKIADNEMKIYKVV